MTKLKIAIDQLGFVIFFLFCSGLMLCSMPWFFRQRKVWRNTAKGNNKALVIQGMTIEKVQLRGYEYLLPFRNPCLQWIGFMDPVNLQHMNIEVMQDLHIILRRIPKFAKLIAEKGFEATSTPLRELSAVFKIIRFCVSEQIGVLRAYKHDYAALRAYLVWRLLKIPYIVDISINFELVRRLSGKKYYFEGLHKVPIMRVFAPVLTNWLYALPLRNALHVFGRNKCTYEHAFALGTPVERLSLLRISNFDERFNLYNPENGPPRPLEWPYFLLVGRLTSVKFPLDAIEAFDLVAQHLPEHHLVLIGDGGMRHDIEERIERSEFKSRILMLGARSSEEVFNWTIHATASISPFSGSTLVEAMLCGIPVIAYDVAGHAEIVFDDYTGFLVPFRDTAALAEKMVYVVRNYREARAVGMRGREFVRVVFDRDRISKNESKYYLEALRL